MTILPSDVSLAIVKVRRPEYLDVRVFADAGPQESVDARAREFGEAEIKKGRAVTWGDGTREWIDQVVAMEEGEVVFHADGARIRVLRKRVTVSPSGERTERMLRPVWRLYDKVFED